MTSDHSTADTDPALKHVRFSGYSDDKSKFWNKRARIQEGLTGEPIVIDNFNGSQDITLTTAERDAIAGTDVHVFLPLRGLAGQYEKNKFSLFKELFMAASLMVGIQTRDPKMLIDPEDDHSPHKPVILLNPSYADYPRDSDTWGPFLNLVRHLYQFGTISPKQVPEKILTETSSTLETIECIKHPPQEYIPPSINHGISDAVVEAALKTQLHRPPPPHRVCVFCSASTRNREFKQEAWELGKSIAAKGWGLITGAGTTGSMGAVNLGARKNKGWRGGSNLLRIFNLEGVPKNMDEIWVKGDIYTRMEIMMENSDSFVILPGGMGTVQEFMALLLIKHRKIQATKEGENIVLGKPIIVVNQPARDPATGEYVLDEQGKPSGIWDPLITLAKNYGFEHDFVVVENQQQATDILAEFYQRKDAGLNGTSAIDKLRTEPRPSGMGK